VSDAVRVADAGEATLVAAQSAVPRLVRVVLAALLGVAGLIHLVLTPEHAAEQPVFGVFFASAAAMQIALAVTLGVTANPSPRLLRVGIVLGLVLVLIWSVTRIVAPPLAPEGHGAETVTGWGVVASGVELGSVIGLLMVAARSGWATRRSGALAWAAAAGIGYFLVFALSSSMVVYNADGWPSDVGSAPGVTIRDATYLTLTTPRLNVVLTDHVALTAPLLTYVFLGLSTLLLASNVAIGLLASSTARSKRAAPGALLVAPALLAGPVCCAAPLLAFLGTTALGAVAVYSPVLLAAVSLLLALQGSAMLRQRRLAAGTT
jgi:hypothetical protein